jgi:hypothetical protein
MKTFSKIIFTIVLLYFTSCEKVIYIDLNSTNPKVIVEGNITNLAGPYTVLLSHSVNYYDPNTFPPVTGAVVTVSDNAGNSEILSEVIPGKYQTSSLQGVEGRTYSLKIEANGNEYAATSTMPYHVPIDSINYEQEDDGDYRIVCKFKDPAGVANYYKLKITTNDTAGIDSSNIRIVSDKFADGQELSLTYHTHLLLNDSVFAKLEGIDKVTYDFYRTVPDVEGDIRSFMSAPPANPVNNISNGGLGYFAAYTISRDTSIVH